MKDKYKKYIDTFGFLKVLSTFIATLYIIYWFLLLFKETPYIAPYVKYVSMVMGIPVNIIDSITNSFFKVNYKGAPVDMTPVIVAATFQAMYFVFQAFASVCEGLRKKRKREIYEKRKIEERLVNKDLKQVFKQKTLRYSKFAIVLHLDLKPAVNPELMNDDINFNDLKMSQYVQIVSAMRHKYVTCKAITPNKLFIMYDNFTLFDDFFTDILKEIKLISTENLEKNIKTNFIIAIGAMDDNVRIANVLDRLEAITSLNYSNKAIATSAFNIRYGLNNGRKYNLETMGISRLEKTQNGIKESEDVELYSLKPSKTKR